MAKQLKLPSGRSLEITEASFGEAKALYQAICAEMLRLSIGGAADLGDLMKNVLCIGICSPIIEAALAPCLKRCLYEGARITPDTFEPTAAREDFNDICMEVIRENVGPFTKSLLSQFRALVGQVATFRASLGVTPGPIAP